MALFRMAFYIVLAMKWEQALWILSSMCAAGAYAIILAAALALTIEH